MPDQESPAWQIEFYQDGRGLSPVEEFLKSLSVHERAEALHVIDLLQAYGLRLGMPHARPISGMWELRAGPGRLF